jgi:membrane protease YdiL (CAAX protease family)
VSKAKERGAMTWSWVALNLLVANFGIRLLPQNLWAFVVAMGFPALSAIVFLKLEGKPIREGLNMRRGTWVLYAAAIVVPLLVCAVTALLGWELGLYKRDHNAILRAGNLIPTLVFWIVAALGEELGWRGYLQNHLRIKHAPLVIGSIWWAWHLGGMNVATPYMYGVFLVDTIMISYLLAWMSKSVWACGLFHGFWDFLRMRCWRCSSSPRLRTSRRWKGCWGWCPCSSAACRLPGCITGNTALTSQPASA